MFLTSSVTSRSAQIYRRSPQTTAANFFCFNLQKTKKTKNKEQTENKATVLGRLWGERTSGLRVALLVFCCLIALHLLWLECHTQEENVFSLHVPGARATVEPWS